MGNRDLGQYLEGGVEWQMLFKMREMTASLYVDRTDPVEGNFANEEARGDIYSY